MSGKINCDSTVQSNNNYLAKQTKKVSALEAIQFLTSAFGCKGFTAKRIKHLTTLLTKGRSRGL